MLGGVAWVSAVIAAPGHIRYGSTMSSIEFGAPAGEAARAKAADFAARCRRAGFGAEMVDDVRSALWNKLIGLSANAALTSAARLPAGPLYLRSRRGGRRRRAGRREHRGGTRTGRGPARGHRRHLGGTVQGVSAGHVRLDYHDIAKGEPLEVEGLSGHIVREGRRLGVPTPHHAALYAVLKPHRGGTPMVG